jgi:hypothetical protein
MLAAKWLRPRIPLRAQALCHLRSFRDYFNLGWSDVAIERNQELGTATISCRALMGKQCHRYLTVR